MKLNNYTIYKALRNINILHEHDLALVERMTFFGSRFVWKPTLPNYKSYLIKLRKN